jgi:hypothetical protein
MPQPEIAILIMLQFPIFSAVGKPLCQLLIGVQGKIMQISIRQTLPI